MSEASIGQLLLETAHVLRGAGVDTPRLDAELLLAHVLGRDRPWLHAHGDLCLTAAQRAVFSDLLARRRQRVPLAYLVGHKEFFGLDFEVTPAVLIPRPETELLVEKVLNAVGDWGLENREDRPTSNNQARITIVDVGTGSGCIGVALAVYLPRARIIVTDLSFEALRLARRNAVRHGVVARLTFVQADLLGPLAGPVDVVVSNPPYVSPAELARAMPEVVGYEPALALAGGGPDGLAVLRRLLAMLPSRLRPGGAFFIEIGSGQGRALLELARRLVPGAEVRLEKDLAGRDRVLAGA